MVTVCGLVERLSATLMDGDTVPGPVGVNCTLMLQDAPPGVRVAFVQVVLTRVKLEDPLPVRLTPLMVTLDELPVGFETLTVWAELAVPIVLEKLRLVGENWMPWMPEPVKVTVCGLPGALSAMLIEAR